MDGSKTKPLLLRLGEAARPPMVGSGSGGSERSEGASGEQPTTAVDTLQGVDGATDGAAAAEQAAEAVTPEMGEARPPDVGFGTASGWYRGGSSGLELPWTQP